MAECIEWGKLSWQEAAEVVRDHPLALLPLGAIEEHGPHMTLETDARAAGAFARRLASESGCVLLPVLPYGQVWSLKNFPGSLTIRDATYVSLIVDLCTSVASKGFTGVVAVTAHLGNLAPLKLAARELHDSGGIPLLSLFYPGLEEVASEICTSRRAHRSIIHADEIETSLLLALAPDCVDMSRAAPEYPDFPGDFDTRALTWDAVSKSGVFGDPTAATAEKGNRMLDRVTERAVSLVRSFQKSVAGGE